MSLQSWQETKTTAQVDGTALANSLVATSLLPAAAKFTLWPTFFQVGTAIRVFAAGRVSNIVTTPGTLTLDIRFGSIVVATGGAITLNVAAKTNVSWWLDWLLTCRAIGGGTTANLMHQGAWISESVVSAPAGTAGTFMLPASAPAVGAGFDSTTAQTVDLFATWSIANAGNSIQLHQMKLVALN